MECYEEYIPESKPWFFANWFNNKKDDLYLTDDEDLSQYEDYDEDGEVV